MIRNLKFLGLAVMVAMALSAMVASAASAEEFKAESTPVTLTGTQEKHKETVTNNMVFDKFKTTGGTLECSTATYKGTQSTSPATSVNVTPAYGGCTFSGTSTEFDTNGCEYRFKITGAKTGTVDVVCPAGKEIVATTPPTGTRKCTVDIPPQNGINGVTYTNIGAGATREITVAIDANNIKYKETEGSGVGHCGTSVLVETGAYEGAATVTGENAAGTAHIGIFIE